MKLIHQLVSQISHMKTKGYRLLIGGFYFSGDDYQLFIFLTNASFTDTI